MKSLKIGHWNLLYLDSIVGESRLLMSSRNQWSLSLMFTMGTTSDEMGSVEQTSSSFNPLCFECGQQHWTRENHLYNYQDEVDDDLVCHICLQPLLQPLDTPCGHTFCCKCLRNFLQEKDFCPLDRKRLHFKSCKKSSILVHKLLDKLLVSCPFSSVCHDVMQRCDLEGHLKNR